MCVCDIVSDAVEHRCVCDIVADAVEHKCVCVLQVCVTQVADAAM